MTKFWRVVRYEYTRHVLRRRFVFSLLSVPAILAAMALLVFFLIRSDTNPAPVGYVDHSGLLSDPLPPPEPDAPDRPIELLPFESEAQAQTALEAKRIQAYYILPEDYPETGQARLVSNENPSGSALDQFRDFVRVNLLRDEPEPIAERLAAGTEVVVETPDHRQRMGEDDWVNIFVPILAGLAFMIAIFTSSGYLMQAVVEEKENRTIEILLTSVSSGQLMSGKIIGIIGVGLTQLLIWIGFALLIVQVGRNYIELLAALTISPSFILLLVVTLLPVFVMISALMAAIGATVTDTREGQQITGLFTLPVVAPFWLASQLITSPNSPLALALSFFPLTAPVTLTFRAGFGSIPPWQLALNVLVLVLSAAASLWIAGRAFHLGMLRYGQRLKWRDLFGRTG
jgi:ABC-2 type transport system permease protein